MALFLSYLVFKPEELRQALMPTLEALYKQDPESLPFRQPVDPMVLGIPVSAYSCVLSLKCDNPHIVKGLLFNRGMAPHLLLLL